MTRRRRRTPEQIIRKLAEGNKRLAGGSELDEVCRHLERVHPECSGEKMEVVHPDPPGALLVGDEAGAADPDLGPEGIVGEAPSAAEAP